MVITTAIMPAVIQTLGLNAVPVIPSTATPTSTADNTTSGNILENTPDHAPCLTGNNQPTVTSVNSETLFSVVTTESVIPHNSSTSDKTPDIDCGTLSSGKTNLESNTTGDTQIMVTSNSPVTTGNVVTMELELPDNKSTPDMFPNNQTADSSISVSAAIPETKMALNSDTPIGVHNVDNSLPQNRDNTSNDSSVVNLDKTTANVVTQFSGILTKECRVVLKPLDPTTAAELNLHSMKIKSATEDTSSIDSGKDTLSDQTTSDSDEIPIYQLFNQDRGRPHRKMKKVKYEESSPCSDSDSNFEQTPKKQFKPHPRLGPSADQLHAHRH